MKGNINLTDLCLLPDLRDSLDLWDDSVKPLNITTKMSTASFSKDFFTRHSYSYRMRSILFRKDAVGFSIKMSLMALKVRYCTYLFPYLSCTVKSKRAFSIASSSY